MPDEQVKIMATENENVGKLPMVARTPASDRVPRHVPGEPRYAWAVRVGLYVERRCACCGMVFAYRASGKAYSTCSSPCAERWRQHGSGTTRKKMAAKRA